MFIDVDSWNISIAIFTEATTLRSSPRFIGIEISLQM